MRMQTGVLSGRAKLTACKASKEDDSFLHGSKSAHTIAGSEEGRYTLTRDFVVAMIEHFKAQKLIHKRFAFQILTQACISCSAPVSCYMICNGPMLHLLPLCREHPCGLIGSCHQKH